MNRGGTVLSENLLKLQNSLKLAMEHVQGHANFQQVLGENCDSNAFCKFYGMSEFCSFIEFLERTMTPLNVSTPMNVVHLLTITNLELITNFFFFESNGCHL